MSKSGRLIGNTHKSLRPRSPDVSLSLSLSRLVEEVQGLPPAGRPRLHAEQQDVRHGAQQADAGGGHRLREGRRHAGHLHEGQRRGGRGGRLEPGH